MSAPCGPPPTRGTFRRRASYAGYASAPRSDLRVSDAERAEVADRLSKHYGDGRLDQTEFNERLDQAMRAKTHSDLDGLFSDLPDAGPAEVPGAVMPRRQRRPYHRVLFLILLVVVTAAIAHTLVWSPIPWLLIGLLVFLWLRHGPWHHRP